MDQARENLTPVLLSIDAGPVRYRKVLDRLLSEDDEEASQAAAAE
jgi:hypothetical protein